MDFPEACNFDPGYVIKERMRKYTYAQIIRAPMESSLVIVPLQNDAFTVRISYSLLKAIE